MRSFWSTTAACALAAGGAFAQDAGETVELPTLTVTADADQGFYGQTFEDSASKIMKSDAPILETPRSVSVVTQQQMQDRGVRSLVEALQYTPGVMAGTYGNDNRGDWTLIRGFEPTIFLDGMQSYFGYYNNVRPEPFLLDSIQVLKGPSAMLYGNGAAGGIINESSKLPNPLAPNIIELTIGNHNYFQSAIDFGGELGPDGKLLYRLVGLGRSADGIIDYSNDDAAAFAPSLTWQPTEDTSFTVLASWQKNETSPYIQFLSPYGTLWSAEPFANGDFLPNDVFIGEPSFNYYNGERRAVSLFGEHAFDEVWGIGGSLRYTESEVDYAQMYGAFDFSVNGGYNPDGTFNRLGELAHNDSKALIGDLHGTADFSVGRSSHAVMFGAAFTDASHNYDFASAEQRGPIDPFHPVYTGYPIVGPLNDLPPVDFAQSSIYAQDQMVFAERLHLDLGARYDWIETDSESWQGTGSETLKDEKPSFSAGLLYAMDNGLSPYVSYSESFIQEAFGTDAAGNAFEPTRGKQYEAGVKYQPAGTNVLLTAAAFELTKSNILVSDRTNPNFSRQQGEATSRGFELGAQGSWRGLSFDLAYTRLDTEDADGDPLEGVPDDQASAWLQYAFAGRMSGLEAGVGVRYVGSTVSPADAYGAPEITTPSHTLYDAMLAYTWNDYRVALTGQNLADTTYTSNCSAYTCAYGTPRTVGLTLTAAF